MLEQLAQVAIQHAAAAHGLTEPLSLLQVDEILDRERELNSDAAVAPCFGAWFGIRIIELLGGQWVGLHEPVAPRVLTAGGSLCSPIDAVERRLKHATAPRLSDLLTALQRSEAAGPTATRLATLEHNQAAWARLADNSAFTFSGYLPWQPAEAMQAIDEWLRAESLAGKRLLCLAAGGGTHAPLHAVAGAEVVVVDFCDQLLSIDRQIARERHLSIRTVCNSMDCLSELVSGEFDMVLQPVSMSYVADPSAVYGEVYRVLRPGGLYVMQHKQPTALRLEPIRKPFIPNPAPRKRGEGSQFSDTFLMPGATEGYQLLSPLRPGRALAETSDAVGVREPGVIEYAHSLAQLLGDLCDVGFRIEAFAEPPRGDVWAEPGTAAHRAQFAPPYMKIKARRDELTYQCKSD